MKTTPKVEPSLPKNKNSTEINPECAICFWPMTHVNDAAILNCDHKYHDKCMRDWIVSKTDGNASCPTCQQNIYPIAVSSYSIDTTNDKLYITHSLKYCLKNDSSSLKEALQANPADLENKHNLLVNNSESKIISKGKFNLLHLAVDKGYTDVVKQLISSYKETELNYLISIVANSDLVKMMIDEKPEKINTLNKNKERPINAALLKGLSGSALVLLKQGAQFNYFTIDNGFSCLQLAIQCNSYELAKDLIESGININSQDFDGNTALMATTANNYNKFVELLLKNNADLNLVNENNETCFGIAINNGFDVIVDKIGNFSITRGKIFNITHNMILIKYHDCPIFIDIL